MSLPPYPKYKDSGVEWLGEIPTHWEALPLFGVAVERNEPNRGMVQNNLLSLSYGRIVQKDIDSNNGLLPESFETYQIVHPGDIVFRLTDLQNDKRSLRTAIVEELGIITSAYLAAIPLRIHPQFFHYILRAYDLTKVFYSMGGGLRQSMNFWDVKRLPILVPSPEEQLGIATFLDAETDKIDALIEQMRRLIELLQEKRQSVISHAVTKGLNPDAPMKDSGIEWIGKVPAHWRVLRIKHVSQFTTSGPRGWSDRISEDGSIFVQSGDLDNELRIQFGGCNRVRVEDGAEATRTRLANGDAVVCITGAKTGNVAVCDGLKEPAYVNQHLCLIRGNGSTLPRFLGSILKSSIGQTHFELSQYGMKQGLSLEDIREAPMLAPPPSEQRQILDRLDLDETTLGALSRKAASAIDLLQERRTALISAAVTGKIDVRNLATTEAA